MSTTHYLLNAGLLAFVLLTNLGVKTVDRRRFGVPLLLVGVAAFVLLRSIPTDGHDVGLELVGAGVGAALGVVAAALVRVDRDGSGLLVMRAGLAYAALWTAVIGGRCLFAYGADHWFSRQIGAFSMTHGITGADAWTAAFVLMSLTMVVVRVATTGALVARAAVSAGANRA